MSWASEREVVEANVVPQGFLSEYQELLLSRVATRMSLAGCETGSCFEHASNMTESASRMLWRIWSLELLGHWLKREGGQLGVEQARQTEVLLSPGQSIAPNSYLETVDLSSTARMKERGAIKVCSQALLLFQVVTERRVLAPQPR